MSEKSSRQTRRILTRSRHNEIMRLTEEQQKAVDITGRSIAIVAGAGSGKTETLAERILADQSRGIDHAQQVAITFTRFAGEELRARIEKKGAKPPWHVGTLHSWAFRSISSLSASRPPYGTFRVINDKEYTEIIKEIIAKSKRKMAISEARRVAMESGGTAGNAKVMGLMIRNFMLRKKLLHADLMLSMFSAELQLGTAIEQGMMLYVDEFQDTAGIDATIYKLIREEYGAGFYAVGDWRQAIYGFRGASATHFQSLFMEADETASLTKNWRSGVNICEVANRIALGIPSPDFVNLDMEDNGQLDQVLERDFQSAEQEALEMINWVAQQREKGVKEIAILTRYNQGVSLIAGVLRSNDIQVQASTDQAKLEEETNDLDIDALMEMCVEPTEKAWKEALAAVGAALAVQDALAGRLSRIQTKDEIIDVLRMDDAEPDQEKVWVSTIHAAKGLEWESVWLAGLDEKAFKPVVSDLCLAFVGVTRAKTNLMMTYASSRQSHTREIGLKRTNIDMWGANS